MRLWFEIFDGRERRSAPVIDKDDADKEVGTVWSIGVGGDRTGGGINVSLFNGKYAAHNLHKMDEAWGFVKGAEAVLKHVGWLLAHEAKQKQSTAA